MNTIKSEKNHGCPGNIPKGLRLIYAILTILSLAVIILCFKVCGFRKHAKFLEEQFSAWVDKNPEAIISSVNKYAERRRGEQQAQQTEKVGKNMDAIISEKSAGIYNPSGKKVVVVFFDYNCGYCKKASKAIEEVVKEIKNVKVLFKDLPIFGGISTTAAKYSVAVSMVEGKKFFDFHKALMGGDAGSEKGIEDALVVAKINVEKIKKALSSKSKEIEERIDANLKLAGNLEIGGTPAMLINGKFIPGYVEASTMKDMLK
ncbi:MAG: DsbA family protein [Rickettsiales bacterium]|jgi:protein-disulfide isomerase|nr:DsbA family protein [Rickettsiales bacterium]